jgi:hypothetical protein
MEFPLRPAAIAAAIFFASLSQHAHAGLPFFNKKNKDHDAKVAQIPHCSKKLGSISVIEPEASQSWWTGRQLPSPSRLIKVFVSKSGCFTLLDRNSGMDAAMRERALASGGELRSGSNLGKGQVKVADYVLVPDLIDANNDAGGGAISGLAQSLLGGTAGRVAGSVSLNSKTADVRSWSRNSVVCRQMRRRRTNGRGEDNRRPLAAVCPFVATWLPVRCG